MTSRNNMNRIGVPAPDDSVAAAVPQEDTKTMGYAVPTEIVDLPSKGAFYKEGHPLFGRDTIEIRHMTAKDEDILTNPSLIKKGVVLDRLLESVIVDKTIKISDLLICDKSALIVTTRINAYGEEYSVKIPCANCGAVADYEFDLNEATKVSDFEDVIDQVDDVSLTEKGTFLITLPRTKAVVEVRPLDGVDEQTIAKTNAMRAKNKMQPLGLTDQIKMFVKSVNSNEDRGYISEFVDNMPAGDSLYMRSRYSLVMPSFELVQDWACNDCQYEQVLEVPFTSEFFWPKQ
jgi:hypothetical protein